MSAVSISVTPSSTARRTTRTPSARSSTMRIAPKPTRRTSSSPPIMKVGFTSGRLVVTSLKSRGMQRLLVANRGEIALRIFRAARALGIETVAVVAPDDLGSLHARTADATVEIASYLDPVEHVRAARESGADAVHPGYGFLAESAELADAILHAGLIWVGPPPAALRAGGDKLAAKRTALSAGVAVLPTGTPEEIGFPLLVKAAAGGGGRGMRIVRDAAGLDDAVDAAQREAASAFGDDAVFFE